MTDFEQMDRYRSETAQTDFGSNVPLNGYRWWYVDGISDDGHNGIVIIGFIGSVFSPYYYAARQRGPADPREHCAINIGLYRPRGGRWCMTERSSRSVERGIEFFRVGRSQMTWQSDELVIDIDERAAPFSQRVTGRVVLRPRFMNAEGFYLDPHDRHRWRPVAPSSEIDVTMHSPTLRWRGHGYFDTNSGQRALEDDFRGWSWTRREGQSHSDVTYSITMRDGKRRAASIRVSQHEPVRELPLPSTVDLKPGLWRVRRNACCGQPPRQIRDLEDTPFYTRSILTDTQFPGDTMHEYLDLDRFRSRWVRLLLPFRMPRVR